MTISSTLLHAITGESFDRVRRALAGELIMDELTADELRVYDHALLLRFAHPSAAERSSMAALGQQSGAVGLNDAGDLVERSQDGKLHVLASAKPGQSLIEHSHRPKDGE